MTDRSVIWKASNEIIRLEGRSKPEVGIGEKAGGQCGQDPSGALRVMTQFQL